MTPSTRPQTEFFEKHLEAISESSSLRTHLAGIWMSWEASGRHLELQTAMGLQEAPGSNCCNTSSLNAKVLFFCRFYKVFLKVSVTKSCK